MTEISDKSINDDYYLEFLTSTDLADGLFGGISRKTWIKANLKNLLIYVEDSANILDGMCYLYIDQEEPFNEQERSGNNVRVLGVKIDSDFTEDFPDEVRSIIKGTKETNKLAFVFNLKMWHGKSQLVVHQAELNFDCDASESVYIK